MTSHTRTATGEPSEERYSPRQLPPTAELVIARVPADEAGIWQAKAEQSGQIPVGSYDYGDGEAAIIGITPEMLRSGIHIIGTMGTGKTVLLEQLAQAAFASGDGGMVIELYGGDLTRQIMTRLPRGDWRRVIHLDPRALLDSGRVMTIGSLFEYESKNEVPSLRMFAQGLLRELLGASTWDVAPRLAWVLDVAVQTLLETEAHATLLSLHSFLADASYRRKMVAKLGKSDLGGYWDNLNADTNEAQLQDILKPMVTAIMKVVVSEYYNQMMDSPHPHLNVVGMGKIMDEGKIVLVNLNGAGEASNGGDTVLAYIGRVLLGQLERAIGIRSGTVPVNDQRPFYTLLDEGVVFAQQGLLRLMVMMRQGNVGLAFAHQSLEQLPDDMRDELPSYFGNRISFRVDSSDAKRLAGSMFTDEVSTDDLSNLHNGHAYARVMNEGKEQPVCSLQVLPRREPLVWDYPTALLRSGLDFARKLHPASDGSIERLLLIIERSLAASEQSQQKWSSANQAAQRGAYDKALDALTRASSSDFAEVQELQQQRDHALADWLYDHPGACSGQVELIKELSMLTNTTPRVLMTAERQRERRDAQQ